MFIVYTNTMSTSKTYCPLPFNHTCVSATGKYLLCCDAVPNYSFPLDKKFISDYQDINEWFHSEYMHQVRTSMLKGKPLRECAHCYKEEAKGRHSPRMGHVEKYPHTEQAHNIDWIDIKFGNKCNLKCKICYPGSSSELMKEWQQLGWQTDDPMEGTRADAGQNYLQADYDWPAKKKNFNKLVDMAQHVSVLKFTGGEPMINPYMIKFLETVIELDHAKNIDISITTNCTKIHPRLFDILSKFKNFNIRCSIDGVGKTYEYIRYPASFGDVKQNFLSYAHQQQKITNFKNISINCVVNYFNFHNMIDFVQEFAPYGYDITFAELYNPSFMSYKNLDNKIIEQVKEQFIKLSYKTSNDNIKNISTKFLRKFFVQNNSQQHNELTQLANFVRAQDNLRSINIGNYIPDISRYLQQD